MYFQIIYLDVDMNHPDVDRIERWGSLEHANGPSDSSAFRCIQFSAVVIIFVSVSNSFVFLFYHYFYFLHLIPLF